MKISLTINQKTYSIETDEGYDGSDLNTIAEEFKGLLVNAGFHPSNVDNLFNTEYQWFTEEERRDNMQGHLKNKRIEEFQQNLYRQSIKTAEDDDEYDMFK